MTDKNSIRFDKVPIKNCVKYSILIIVETKDRAQSLFEGSEYS